MEKQLLTIFKQALPFPASRAGRAELFHRFSVANIVHITALIVTVGIYSPMPATAAPEDYQKAGTVKTQPKKTEDLPNFHKVHPFLYRGGEPSIKGVEQLSEMGIKTIIDLRAPTKAAREEEKKAKALGIKYINLPMSDKAPTEKQVATTLSTIEKGRETGEPVFVHCQHGSDRTGCMIGIWRVSRDGWKFDRTYKEMRKYYFGPKYDKLRNAVKERASS
ncbi:MAG: dual specificity protein phosphatase family protein [Candidatus Obscuribacterales bacterium]|nr:dual specificity protein phosphatase family protein [Cyanobacteria bacterium HKST-UBA01]MCB9468635.1 dual specificity protein phosphatase family protein [Candidatus Obscuribacterales bacterium]